jgi:hypothetical protein
VREPLHSGSAGLRGYPLGSLDMHGVKSLLSVLDIKTDRIHHTVGASKGIGDRTLVVNVGLDRLELRIIKSEQAASSIRMP